MADSPDNLAAMVDKIQAKVFADAVVDADADQQRAMFQYELAQDHGDDLEVAEKRTAWLVAQAGTAAMVMLFKTTQNDPEIQTIDGWVVRAYVVATGRPPGATVHAPDPQRCVECDRKVRVTIQGMCTDCRREVYANEEANDEARSLMEHEDEG